jgi:hypothetical protein
MRDVSCNTPHPTSKIVRFDPRASQLSMLHIRPSLKSSPVDVRYYISPELKMPNVGILDFSSLQDLIGRTSPLFEGPTLCFSSWQADHVLFQIGLKTLNPIIKMKWTCIKYNHLPLAYLCHSVTTTSTKWWLSQLILI